MKGTLAQLIAVAAARGWPLVMEGHPGIVAGTRGGWRVTMEDAELGVVPVVAVRPAVPSECKRMAYLQKEILDGGMDPWVNPWVVEVDYLNGMDAAYAAYVAEMERKQAKQQRIADSLQKMDDAQIMERIRNMSSEQLDRLLRDVKEAM